MNLHEYWQKITGCGTQIATGPEICPFIKNPQFCPKHVFIQVILSTHGYVILTKFHNDRVKIVDFLINSINSEPVAIWVPHPVLGESFVVKKWNQGLRGLVNVSFII